MSLIKPASVRWAQFILVENRQQDGQPQLWWWYPSKIVPSSSWVCINLNKWLHKLFYKDYNFLMKLFKIRIFCLLTHAMHISWWRHQYNCCNTTKATLNNPASLRSPQTCFGILFLSNRAISRRHSEYGPRCVHCSSSDTLFRIRTGFVLTVGRWWSHRR